MTTGSSLRLLMPLSAIFCIIFGLIAPAGSAPARKQQKATSGAPTTKPSKFPIRIWVKNPNCPDCLKTLKTYLLAIPGVKAVWLHPVRPNDAIALIVVIVEDTSLEQRIVERVKAHDLLVVNVNGKKALTPEKP